MSGQRPPFAQAPILGPNGEDMVPILHAAADLDDDWPAYDDEDEARDAWDWDPSFDADPGCGACFGGGGWGSQDAGWTDCPDCFAAWLAEIGDE